MRNYQICSRCYLTAPVDNLLINWQFSKLEHCRFPCYTLEQLMKNIAKLTLFFTLSFIILFLIFILLRLLSTWVDLARIVPVTILPGEDAAKAAWNAFPATIYISMLLALSYTARRKTPVFMAIICVWVLGAVFTVAATIGISRVENLKPAVHSISSLHGRPGLILSRQDTAMVLLRESSVVRGPRVVSIPNQSLIYQEVPVGPNNAILSLPALPFTDDLPWFLRSLYIDFSLSAHELERRLDADFSLFAAYALSLILLLGSLRFVLGLSQWPLANFFLGAVVFRLILALEIFLNSKQINDLIFNFLDGKVPSVMITPLVFGTMTILVIFYTITASIAKPRRNDA